MFRFSVAVVIAMTLSMSAMAETAKISDAFMTEAMGYVTSEKSIATMSTYLAKQVANGEVTFDNMDAPPIIFVEKAELIKRFLSEKSNKALVALADNVEAFYDINPYSLTYRSIFLLNTWDESKLLDRETLIHELVHHAQLHADVIKVKLCKSELESAAYIISLSYLVDNGETDQAVIDSHKWYSLIFGQCQSRHPRKMRNRS